MADIKTLLSTDDPGTRAKGRISPAYAYTVIIGWTVILFFVGMLIGKTFFWENYDKRADVEKKLEIALEQLKADPKDPQRHVNVGWAYLELERYNEAIKEINNAINIDNQFFPAYFNLGLAYMQVQKYDLAVEAFKKALVIQPRSPQVKVNLGIVYNKLGKHDVALKELQDAYQLNRGSVETIYEIGYTYELLGNKEEALYQYQSALQFAPQNEKLKEAIKRVSGGAPSN